MQATFHKIATLILGAFLFISTASAGQYTIDRGHSGVGFTIRHMVTKVHGRFTDFSGTIQYDAGAPEKTTAEVTVVAKSINTDDEGRDKNLRGNDFFAADSFPTLSYKSTKAVKTPDGLSVEGVLTIRGISKPITVPVEVTGEGNSPVMGFSTTFKIDRKEFHVNWNRALDRGGLMLGDEVTINIDIEARLPKK